MGRTSSENLLPLTKVVAFLVISCQRVLLNTQKYHLPGNKRERRPNTRAHGDTFGTRAQTAEMTRRCSHCSNNGHNARTCPVRGSGGGGVRLFGVRLTSPPEVAMKKSASMSCIVSSLGGGSGGSSPAAGGGDGVRGGGEGGEGYVSDDPAHASCSTNGHAERKKGKIFFVSVASFALLVSCLCCSIKCGGERYNFSSLDCSSPWRITSMSELERWRFSCHLHSFLCFVCFWLTHRVPCTFFFSAVRRRKDTIFFSLPIFLGLDCFKFPTFLSRYHILCTRKTDFFFW